MAQTTSSTFKRISMGVNLENGFFSEDGSTGFNISSFGGRVTLSFWKKGETQANLTSPNDNKISININQAIILNKVLAHIITSRTTQFREKGVESYSDITNLSVSIQGIINNQAVTFGILRFDTVEIDGIKRVKISLIKENYNVSVVFCDKIMKNIVNENVKTNFDIYDTSFYRFCTEINNFVNFSWMQGAFNKIYARMIGNNNQQYNNRSSANTRYESSNNENDNSELFDDNNF
jgi:hypothetical protein